MQENEIINSPEESDEIKEIEESEESSLQKDADIPKEADTPDTKEEDEKEDEVDYEALMKSDLIALKREFKELMYLNDISQLENPLRYGALRDLGLTPAEAYLASCGTKRSDNRSHLYSSVPKRTQAPGTVMSESELNMARELFPNVSDAEIRRLYKKVK